MRLLVLILAACLVSLAAAQDDFWIVVGRTDKAGYLMLPALRPYESNRVRLEVEDLPLDARIGSAEAEAVPYERSGVDIGFDLRRERQATARLIGGDGRPLPAGLRLANADGTVSAWVAKDGFTQIVGVDVSHHTLGVAAKRLDLEQMPPSQRARIDLLHGSLTYRDRRLAGYDGAAVVEVIEHLDPSRLAAFERVLFEFARPGCVVVLGEPGWEDAARAAGAGTVVVAEGGVEALATEAAQAFLGVRVDPAPLARVTLPGRLERRGREVRDGAHNPEGVRWLVERLEEKDYTVMASILREKDVERMLGELSAVGKRFVATRSSAAGAVPVGLRRHDHAELPRFS